MPTLKDLLDAKKAAVKVRVEKRHDTLLALEALAEGKRVVEITWAAAVGGVVLKHAAQDQTFHETLDAILNKGLAAKRDRKLLAEWRTGWPVTPEQTTATEAETTTRPKAKRSQALDVDFDTVDADELLQSLAQLEADAEHAQKEQADADADVSKTTKDLRKTDNHWRIKVGETVLAHAEADGSGDFQQNLDRILELRIAEHHRPLLRRWQSTTAPPTAPPPAASTAPPPAASTAPPPATSAAPPVETAAHRGWNPRKLPDNSWGAVFRNPADSATLPEPLVGALIVVKTSNRGELIKKITEVIASDDTEVFVRAEKLEPRNTIASRGASPAAENETATKESEQSPDAAVKRSAG